MLTIHDIRLDLVSPGILPPVAVVQGDTNTRQVRIELYAAGQPWNPPEDCSVAVAYRKPDGTQGLYDTLPDGTAATTITDNSVTAILAPQVTTSPGVVMTSIVFYDESMDALATFPFQVLVTPSPSAGAQISNNYYALQSLEQVNAAYNDLVARISAIERGGNTAGPVGPAITIESKAGGYWDRYNTWYDTDLTCAKRTNLIPVTAGDQYSYMGYAADAVYSVIWYDAKMAEVGNAKHDARTSAVVVTAPAGATCARFYSFIYSATVDLVVLEVIKIASGSAAPSLSQSSLYGKKIIYDGDSICESRTGNTANNGGGYAKLIADSVGGTYVNNAVSGAALTSTPEGKTYHSVVDSLTELPTNGDLYCFEGGYNDFCRNVAIGSCENTGYSGDLDTFTICGAMEHIFRYCMNVLVGRPVCFVIVHKCDNSHTANSAGNTFADYRNAMIAVCEKYSIPYYDAYAKSGLNGWNTVQSDAYLTANVNGTGDGTHPNEAGYKRYYVPQLIALFQSMMPTDVVQNAPGEEDAPTDPSEPAVNLIDTVGYTDGVRLSTSTGSEKTTTEAYTTTGFIRMESATEIFQTSGVVFDGDVHAQSIVCVYDSSKSLLIGAYITSNQTDGKTLSLTYCRLTKDGNGNLTIKPTAEGMGCYFKLSGYGSGAELVITK